MRKKNSVLIFVLLFALVFLGCHSKGHKFTKHEIEYGISARMVDWPGDWPGDLPYDGFIAVKVFDDNHVLSEETYLIDVSNCKELPTSVGSMYIVLTEHFDPEQTSYTAESIYIPRC